MKRTRMPISVVALALAGFLLPSAASAQDSLSFEEVLPRAIAALESEGGSLPENQRNRLRCMLTKLRDNASTDGRYVPNSFLVRQQEERLTDEQLNLIVERVRRDMSRPIAFGTDKSASHIRDSLERLDIRIFQGIAYLNRVAGDGLAVGGGSSVSAGKRQLKDFVSQRQRQEGSIYWCYGEGEE